MLARSAIVLAVAALLPNGAAAQLDSSLIAPYPADRCSSCSGWNAPQPPVQLHGNTWYVGTRGLAAVLITSASGHVLIDAGLPNSAPLIIDNVRALGFDVADIRLILNSHAHFDHAGGIAALQQMSGARVAATEASAAVLERGRSGQDDPQYGVLLDFPPVRQVERIDDGDSVRVGEIVLHAHITAGHTRGGTSWSWQSCDGGSCRSFVYADSQTPVSADNFRFSDSSAYPAAVADFERGFAILERLPCDILITPHPGASSLWERIAQGADGIVDSGACRRYAASARQQLARRLQREATAR